MRAIDIVLCGALGAAIGCAKADDHAAASNGTISASGVVDIEVSPMALIPSFSPSITDYYVRCAKGSNAVTVTITDAAGPNSYPLTLVEDEEFNVNSQYWIRCLPHDFPTITVTRHPDAGAPTNGLYLVNNGTYAIALDTNGTPVWYARGTSPFDVESFGADMVSYMPYDMGPFNYVSGTVFDMRTLDPPGTTMVVNAVGGPTDGHELRLLPNGDCLVYTYVIDKDVDLTGLQSFGPGETMVDCKVEEIDPSGNLVWSWLASDHLDPIRESIEPAVESVDEQKVVDVFHFNSIDVDASGNLLMSARHTNAVFYVDRASGKVVWKLGGSAYNKDGATLIRVASDPQTAFNMQHDARLQPNGDVSLFDDHGAVVDAGVARGVEYAIDHDAGTATVAFQFLGIAESQYEGSFRRYADGESVVGWGYVPKDPRVVTEINGAGQDVLDIAFSGGMPTYRAIKVPIGQLKIDVLRATTAK